MTDFVPILYSESFLVCLFNFFKRNKQLKDIPFIVILKRYKHIKEPS